MILFRADGNAEVGAGHIMRCLSVAAAAAARGQLCRFVLASEEMAPIVRGRGFDCDVLYTDYTDMERELPQLNPVLAEQEPDQIVVDSYFVTPQYLQALRQYAPLVYMDDLAAFAYPVDVLVNYNLYGPELPYTALYEQANVPKPRLLLGVAYVPMRQEFRCLPPHAGNGAIKNVLVSTGGADHEHMARRMVEYLQGRNDLTDGRQYHFIVGPAQPDKAWLERQAENAVWLKLHENVQNMSQMMRSCDIAVSAGGSTVYELCACGTPAILYTLADNQMQIAQTFARSGLIPWAGDIRKNLTDCLHTIESEMERLQDAQLRKERSKRMQQIVDGEGASRIAGEIENTL